MNVTAEQWAQAEAERQRQAEMVQTLFNKVRRLGTEQKIQRVRAEQLLTVPPVEPPGGGEEGRGGRCTTTDNSGRTRNHRHENWEAACLVGRLEFQGAFLRVSG